MSTFTEFGPEDAVPEKSTSVYAAIVKDQDGNPIDPSAVSALTVTLKDAAGTTINSRSDQNCFNANNGTFVTGGALAFTLQPADTTLVGNKPYERRVLTFKVVFSGGQLYHERSFYVKNLRDVS